MKHLTPKNKSMWVLFVLLLAAIPGISQTNYQTIANGDWASPEIWTTDGVSPCACVPPVNMNGISVTISHDVASSSNLHIQGDGILTVSTSGALLMPDKELNVQDGSFIANGFVHLGGLDAGNDGYVLFTVPAIIETKFLILGAIDIMFETYDTLKVMAADVHINPGAVFNAAFACVTLYAGDFDNNAEAAFDNASICTYDGDIVNKGSMSFAANTCASGSGDFINMGTVSGAGAVTMDGMVDNAHGEWTGVYWCGLAGEEMSMEMDCAGADSICALTGQDIPLDISHVTLQATCTESSVLLSWSIEGELEAANFCVERAGPHMNFTPIHCGMVQPDLTSTYFSYEDRHPLEGVAYYRVEVAERNGNTRCSPVESVRMYGNGAAGMMIYPNPVKGSTFNVVLYGHDEPMKGRMEFYAPSGALLGTVTVDQLTGNAFEISVPDNASGPCFVRFICGETVLQQMILVQLN